MTGKRAAEAPFDLLVIGGGINGAGIALDAALRGLSVCLIDQEDWCSGTSSRSSMLAHGGLRYLEQFELGLVHEALQERERMFRLAPHLVRPLRFLYPIYPHIASRRTVRVGLLLYDVLSHGKSVPKRDYVRAHRVPSLAPGIRTEDLIGGATYYDGQWLSVERYVQELVIGASRQGAATLPHVRATRLIIKDGACTGIRVEPDPAVPEAAAALVAAGLSTTIHAKAVVNAAGPWVDGVLSSSVSAPRLIRGTKGTHIAVPRFVDTALIIRANDGRTFFILPWHEHCLIGTTDTDHAGNPAVRATAEEVAYLQDSVRWYFPKAPVEEVQWTYAGVRPLVNETGLIEGNVTRRHVIHDHADDGARGLWSLQGGKLTSYRHLAEEMVDDVESYLGVRKHSHPTRDRPMVFAPTSPWDAFRSAAIEHALERPGCGQATAEQVVDTYGIAWATVLDQGPDAAAPIMPDRPECWGMVRYAAAHEQAFTLADVLFRRTRLGLYVDDAGAKAVAQEIAGILGWDAPRAAGELRIFETYRARYAVPPAP